MALDMGLKKQSGAASPPTISTESFLPTAIGREPARPRTVAAPLHEPAAHIPRTTTVDVPTPTLQAEHAPPRQPTAGDVDVVTFVFA